uniref:Uncharacterized protein n=1 Tax=Romanomermis culicivorax TaxID=13658 RepID=A0A915KJA3_ROMCU
MLFTHYWRKADDNQKIVVKLEEEEEKSSPFSLFHTVVDYLEAKINLLDDLIDILRLKMFTFMEKHHIYQKVAGTIVIRDTTPITLDG